MAGSVTLPVPLCTPRHGTEFCLQSIFVPRFSVFAARSMGLLSRVASVPLMSHVVMRLHPWWSEAVCVEGDAAARFMAWALVVLRQGWDSTGTFSYAWASLSVVGKCVASHNLAAGQELQALLAADLINTLSWGAP